MEKFKDFFILNFQKIEYYFNVSIGAVGLAAIAKDALQIIFLLLSITGLIVNHWRAYDKHKRRE